MARSDHDKERLKEAAKDLVGHVVTLFVVFEIGGDSRQLVTMV